MKVERARARARGRCERRRDGMKRIHRERQGRKKLCGEEENKTVRAQRQRAGRLSRPTGGSETTRFDVLLWSSGARGRRDKEGGRHVAAHTLRRHSVSLALRILRYRHATTVRRAKHLLPTLTYEENFSSCEDKHVRRDETSFAYRKP